MKITAKEIEQRVIECLQEKGPGFHEAILGEVLVVRGDSNEESRLLFYRVLDDMTGRGVVERDGGWYRLPENFETATARKPREIAARLRSIPNPITRAHRPRA